MALIASRSGQSELILVEVSQQRVQSVQAIVDVMSRWFLEKGVCSPGLSIEMGLRNIQSCASVRSRVQGIAVDGFVWEKYVPRCKLRSCFCAHVHQLEKLLCWHL